ncbi:hypothetical protein WJX81_008641 [Elliptochloris bilobata]|uniref:Prion-inhibition and propagation HeLo domain-containing protein n=1 Tax=Elliptochloris bilobata TaxID=381761 RepID=A0AAW1SEK0_9CHLO
MFSLAGAEILAPYAIFAASTVGKKAFEAVALRSMKGLAETLSTVFRGNQEVLRLRKELELRLRMLAWPLDACVGRAVQGNPALQAAVEGALSLLQEVEAFEEALRSRDISQKPGTPCKCHRSAGGLDGPVGYFQYELHVKQDIERDELYHEEGERAEEIVADVAAIAGLSWATAHSLRIGSNDLSPALVFHIAGEPSETAQDSTRGTSAASAPGAATRSGRAAVRRSSAVGSAGQHTSGTPPAAPATPAAPSRVLCKYAIQLRRVASADADEDGSTESGSGGGGGAEASDLSIDWKVLSELEYVLRLCQLESYEERTHQDLGDERLRLAFAAAATATGPSPPGPGPARRPGSRAPSTDVRSLSVQLAAVGFGSPL